MMYKRRFDKILGHNINNNVQTLIEEVTSYFPYKKLLVHPISIANEELREPIPINVNGLAKPSLTNYIGIWINENLQINEFNIILAEELHHHIQAYNKYPAIFGFNDNEYLFTFRNMLNTITLDIDAHHHLLKSNFDITPIQYLDYYEAQESNKGINPTQLFLLSKPDKNAIFFPQYLLWWYDLAYLPSPLKNKWETDINQWFITRIPLVTQEKWFSLIRFIERYPINTSQSAKTAITEVCRKLVRIMPVFTEMKTTGLHIDLIIKELVPIERTPNIKGWGLGGKNK